MKTGIIIHSSTGNTLSVAERVAAACRAHGSDVRVERVTAMDESPQARSVTLRDIPDEYGTGDRRYECYPFPR